MDEEIVISSSFIYGLQYIGVNNKVNIQKHVLYK